MSEHTPETKPRRTKQVIVIRKDLKMRRGKEIAQGCHASMAFLTRQFERNPSATLTPVQAEWVKSSYRKICIAVDTEEELMGIRDIAESRGIEVHLVTDNGMTEFSGAPTRTAVAIGPDYDDVIDPITSEFKLY